MRSFTNYMLFVFMTSLLIFTVLVLSNCSNQPLDVVLDQSGKHSSDVVSEVADCYTGLAVDADAGEYLAIFNKGCVDSILMGTADSGGIPQLSLPAGVTPVEITTIVNDVAAGNTTYERNWVYVEGLVTTDLTDGGRSLLLDTGNDIVKFRVSSFVKVSQLSQWTKGNRYGFILLITDIEQNDTTGITTIFCRVDDPDNITNGRSVLTPTQSDVLVVSIDVLLESFRKGESYYIGKRVGFLDTVKSRQDNQTFESFGTTYDRLVVYTENIGLFETGRDSFSIYPTMQLFEGVIDPKYTKGSLHNFEVTIHYLSGEDFFNPNKVNIVGYFEDKSFLP